MGDGSWIEVLLHTVFYGFLGGLLIFFIAFFGILGYRAGDGLVRLFTGSSYQEENF